MTRNKQIARAAELLDDSQGLLTVEGFNARRLALDDARLANDEDEAERLIQRATWGLS